MRYYLIAALVCLVSIGCQNSGSVDNNKGTTKTSSHSHDGEEHEHKQTGHSHTHADGTTCTCQLGENGGHLFTFENQQYKGEYVISKESEVVRFFLLNNKDEDAPLKVDSFKVIPLAGNDAEPFELEAVSPDAEGKSHIYSAENRDLGIAIPLGVRVEVKAGDLTLTGMIEAHEGSGH